MVFSLSNTGVSATGQIINQRLPVWRTVKDRKMGELMNAVNRSAKGKN